MAETSRLPNIHKAPDNIPQEEYIEYLNLLAPGPVNLPGVNVRNPIAGTMTSYSHYGVPSVNRLGSRVGHRKASQFHRSQHERSIFEDTGYQSSFFIIHPDWTSEAAGIRKLRTLERSHYAWDNRPSQPAPLVDYILPILQKKTEKDSLLREHLASAKANDPAKTARRLTDRERLMQTSLPAVPLERSRTWAPPSDMGKGSEYYRSLHSSVPFRPTGSTRFY